jgi:leucyl-tRNA synthetase
LLDRNCRSLTISRPVANVCSTESQVAQLERRGCVHCTPQFLDFSAFGVSRFFVPCDHEYLNFRGGKFSKSRSAAVDVPYYLSKYDPDPLRFYLTATAPETRDTEACPEGLEGIAWEDFVERNSPIVHHPATLRIAAIAEGECTGLTNSLCDGTLVP